MTRRRRRETAPGPRRRRLRRDPRGLMLLALLAAFLAFGAILQPAVQAQWQAHRQIRDLRAQIAIQTASSPHWLEQAARVRGQVGVPEFYRLPAGNTPEVDAHARTTQLTTQMLELVKATGGAVIQVSVDVPQRLLTQVNVPGTLVFQGDFAGVRQVVAAIRTLSPHIVWRRCRLTPLETLDEVEGHPTLPNRLRVELGFVAGFERAE
jgi:hypothetical protein